MRRFFCSTITITAAFSFFNPHLSFNRCTKYLSECCLQVRKRLWCVASSDCCKVITGNQAMSKCTHLLMFMAVLSILLTSVSQKRAKTSDLASNPTYWTEWMSGQLLNITQRVRRKRERETETWVSYLFDSFFFLSGSHFLVWFHLHFIACCVVVHVSARVPHI